jgi:hypothetical protein
MPKLIIIEPCVVNYGDDRGGVHADVGDEIAVNADTAIALAKAGRGLYVSRDDDPAKGRHTAPEALIAARAAALASVHAAAESAAPAPAGKGDRKSEG